MVFLYRPGYFGYGGYGSIFKRSEVVSILRWLFDVSMNREAEETEKNKWVFRLPKKDKNNEEN